MTDGLPPFAPGFGTGAVKPPEALTRGEAMKARVDAHNAQWGSSRARLPSAPLPDLRAWRLARGWSQFEAAKQTGLSLSTWIRWETKGVPEIRRAKLREILK